MAKSSPLTIRTRRVPKKREVDAPLLRLTMAPAYVTKFGSAYIADALDLLASTPSDSVDLVVTSPPYALHFKKEYGNVSKDGYVSWFMPFAQQIYRALKPSGSFILNIGGSYNPGAPTRSLYHFKLLIALVEDVGFHLAQECFWHNPAKLPAPAEWVTVRRLRIKDSVEYVWWLSKTPWPKANNRNVLVPYSPDMERLIRKGYTPKRRPSGHNITAKFGLGGDGAIPANVVKGADDFAENMIERGNNESNSDYIKACREHNLKIHPARFPMAIPSFFINLCTDEGDLVIDPFAGSNTTGFVAEMLKRRWLSSEINRDYVLGGRLRFVGQGNSREGGATRPTSEPPLRLGTVA